jgi:Tol biopolymer transport system component
MRELTSKHFIPVLLLLPATTWAQSTVRVSVDAHGLPSEGQSYGASLSADGRYVAYSSTSSELVPNDTNGVADVFVRDRVSGSVVRASVSTAGAQADAECMGQYLSADGRFVVFRSTADTLVPGDTNGTSDVFVRDLVNNTTERVSVATGGGQSDADSYYGTISADGRSVLLTSMASNLVPGDTNNALDAFVRDRLLGVTERVSVSSSGAQTEDLSYSVTGTISADGRYVTFESSASNLVAGDHNLAVDVFVHDRTTGTTTRVSLGAGGLEANGTSGSSALSADGRSVVFTSIADNLVPGDTNGDSDVFVRDLVLGTTVRVSVGPGGVEGNDGSYNYYAHTVISDSGRFVTFQSEATNLTATPDLNGTDDVFVRDLLFGTTTLVCASSAGVAGTGESSRPTLSGNGRYIAFESDAPNLVGGDVNGSRDVFVRDVRSVCQPLESYCTGKLNSHGCVPAISSSGEPSASGATPFVLTAVDEVAGSPGVFVWSHGSASTPFGGGTLCLQGPLTRTPPQAAVAHAAEIPNGPCTGAFAFDFGAAFIQGHALSPGTTLFGQYVSRDIGFPAPNNVALSDAIRFTICP